MYCGLPAPLKPQTIMPAPTYAELLTYSPPQDLLAGRVILVTGAADGIGRAVALAYARHGARLILMDHSRKGLQSLHDELSSAGATPPLLCPADLAGLDIAGIREIVTAISRQFGVLDGLLNNAGWVGALMPFEHYDPALWLKIMNVNLAAPFFLTQWCLPLLRRSADPVVGFSLHDCAQAHWSGFAMAKAGQRALLQVLADEYHSRSPQPLRVFGIDPGPVSTAGRRQLFPGEAPEAHPSATQVIGPYLYAMGPQSAGLSPLLLQANAQE